MAQQINLFSPLYLKQKKYFSARTMAQALGLIVFGSALLYGYASFQTRSLHSLLDAAEARLIVGREQLVKLGAELGGRGRSKALADELARLEFQLKQREALLANIDSNAGADSATLSPYLAALARRHTEGVWLTGVSISGGAATLMLKGRAIDAARVPAYLDTLNREAVMQGRQVAELALAAKDAAPSAPGAGTPSLAEPPRFVEFSLNLSGTAAPSRKSKEGSS